MVGVRQSQKYLKRFTPRRKGSVWSERNRALAGKLIANGRMTEAGQAAIDQAQKAGTWDSLKPAPISEAHIDILFTPWSEPARGESRVQVVLL